MEYFRYGLLALAALCIVFMGPASAFTIHSSNPQLDISSCTAGFATVYVTGAIPGSTADFGSSGGAFLTTISPSSVPVSPMGTASGVLSVSSPACFTGMLPVTVTANVCGPAGCQSAASQVQVSVTPCPGPSSNCASPSETAAQTSYGNYPAPCSGSSCTYASSFQQVGYFPPTNYAVGVSPTNQVQQCISGPCDFTQVGAGDSYTASYTIQNTGTGGSFAVSLIPQDSAVTLVSPSVASIDLAPGTKAAVSFTVYTSSTASAGTHKVEVTVTHNENLVGSANDWFEILPSQAQSTLQLVLPSQGVVLDGCQLPAVVVVPATITVTQPGAQDFTVSATVDNQPAYTDIVTVSQSIASQFPLRIPSGLLVGGQNEVNVTAASGELAGSGTFPIFLQACTTPQVTLSATANANGSLITVLALVSNVGSTDVDNVSGQLQGLPPSWSYTSDVVSAIAPGQSQTLALHVIAGDSSQVQPTLVALSGSRPIASTQLPLLGASSSGFTGFFTLDTDSATILVFLIILALACFPALLLSRSVWYTPAASAEEPTDAQVNRTTSYVKRIRHFRQQLPGASPAPSGGDGN